MKLILHIGTEKTGTTTTQHWAARNREAMARKGVVYSQVLGTNCHIKLHLWCMAPGRQDEAFQRINIAPSESGRQEFRARLKDDFAVEARNARNAGCHTFLISSELCHSRLTSLNEVQMAREFLEPHFDEIEILCGLRPQIDLAVSHISNIAKASSRITGSYFDEIGPDSAYYNYKTFIERWSTVFGAETVRLVPIRRTPDFTAVVAEHAGIDTAGLHPPVRTNEALDIRVMAMTNAMKTELMSEKRMNEPFAYISRDVLKQLPCEERLQPGLEVARAVQARFDEINRDLANGRTDVEFSDFEPDWSRYEGAGNLDLLEQPCLFSGQLVALVQLFNQNIALAEIHNEIVESERHLDLHHPVLARRRLNAALAILATLKKSGIPGQRIRKLQERTEALEKALRDSDGDVPRGGRRRAEKEREAGGRDVERRERRRAERERLGAGRDTPRRERLRPEKKREDGGHDAPRGERRLTDKGPKDGGHDVPSGEPRRDGKPRREKNRRLRSQQPADPV